VTLLPWGLAADRFGERIVLALGLTACAVCLFGAAYVPTFGLLLLVLALAGAAGASVNAASGRAVMHWFGPNERGLARMRGSGGSASAAASTSTRRSRWWASPSSSSTTSTASPRERLRLSSPSRKFSQFRFRLGAGRWSDVLGSRIVPLRYVGLAVAARRKPLGAVRSGRPPAIRRSCQLRRRHLWRGNRRRSPVSLADERSTNSERKIMKNLIRLKKSRAVRLAASAVDGVLVP